jgi:hypothetical protein
VRPYLKKKKNNNKNPPPPQPPPKRKNAFGVAQGVGPEFKLQYHKKKKKKCWGGGGLFTMWDKIFANYI